MEIDGYLVERHVTTDPRDGHRERVEYRFQRIATPKSPRSHPEVDPEENPREPLNPEGESNTDNEFLKSSTALSEN